MWSHGLLMLLAALPTTPSFGQRNASDAKAPDGAVAFRNIEEVIERWSPNQHLYVYGDLGLGKSQLADLEKWLSQNGPHWTVVLMEHGRDQAFTAKDGRSYRGLDAVEYALGFALNNRTNFGTLEHPITKEADGAVFVLFLKDRKFSYYGSEAQTRRKLGQAQWLGELDQPAFRAMRSGGRIIDAVKDTVKSINGKLEQAMTSEKRAEQRLQEERQRAHAHAQGALRDLLAAVSDVERSANVFLVQYPKASGPLAKPPLTNWRKSIVGLGGELTVDSTRAVEQKTSTIAVETSRFLNAYAASADFKQHADRLLPQLHRVEKSPSPKARALANDANQLVADASDRLAAGEIDFADLMSQAEEKLRQAEAAVEEERARAAMAQMQAAWVRGTIMAMLAILGLIVAGLLLLANRRRKPLRLRAIDELTQREASVAQETERLDELFQRNDEILGSRQKVEERGYVGTTRDLALKAFDYVDDLFMMSKEVQRVLREAKALVYPNTPWGRLVNLFSGTRFQEAIDHVHGKPLKFSRTTGIPLIVRDMKLSVAADSSQPGAKPEQQSSVESLPDEVSLTFKEIFTAFRQRGIEAEQAIATIEKCLTSVQDELNKFQTQLVAAAAQEKQLDRAAEDGYLDVPNYFTALIPSVQKNLQRADDLSAFDAVEAINGPLVEAKRQLAEASELGQRLLAAREQFFPQLHTHADALQRQGYTSNWIGDELTRLTAKANGLYEAATSVSIAGSIEELTTALETLVQRSGHSLQLAKQINETLTPALSELGKRVTSSRQELASRLKLSVDAVLREGDRNPDDSIARAHSSLDAAKAMLLQGRQSAVEEAITTFKSEAATAEQILKATQGAVNEFMKVRSAVEQRCQEQHSKAPKLRAEIESARKAYATSALVVTSVLRMKDGSTKTTPDPNQPVNWLLSQAEQGAASVQELLQSADSRQRAGEVLAAAEDLSKANAILAIAGGQLQQIAEHLALLASQSRENTNQQAQNESLINNLIQAHRNPLVTAATLQAIEQTSAAVAQNRQLVEVRHAAPNPFESARTLLTTRRQLEQLQAQIVGDQQAHAEAKRAVAGAAQQLQSAHPLVRRSQTDSIPDSPQIIQANNRIAALSADLKQVEHELQEAHADWRAVGTRAAKLQTELSSAARTLGSELDAAHQALDAFQQASQTVLQAGQWSGPWGVRVSGSPGVRELERARHGLQSGNYQIVFQISQLALLAAQAALQQAEREVMRRRMEDERAAEMARRVRQAALRQRSMPTFGGGHSGSSYSGSSHSGSSYSGSSSSSGNESGFGRSGW